MVARLYARGLVVRGGLRDGGASAVEYGLVVFAVAAVVAIAVYALGGPVMGLYADTCAAVNGGVAGSSGPQTC